MNGLSWSVLAIVLVVCHMTFAAPAVRVKREDELTLDTLAQSDVSEFAESWGKALKNLQYDNLSVLAKKFGYNLISGANFSLVKIKFQTFF